MIRGVSHSALAAMLRSSGKGVAVSAVSAVSGRTRAYATVPPLETQRDVFSGLDTFVRRHIGSNERDLAKMLDRLGLQDLEELVQKTVPSSVLQRSKPTTSIGPGASESELIATLKAIASKNKIFKSYIGLGYSDTITPPVILRNILENPGWYTQYTPYQPEISQGRLESLLNYQTMVTDLTGLPIANASLLDEGTAAAEAMAMAFAHHQRNRSKFFVDQSCHPQTIACVRTRADALDVELVVGDFAQLDWKTQGAQISGVLVQYPATDGRIIDFSEFAKAARANGSLVVCATDLLALTLLKPPGEWGADIALGNSQRFGVPLQFGGPHAAFFACRDELKRKVPGRIIGASIDVTGKRALRLALQTREQHIRREKATSNICTAQALLANMAAMFAVYHGPKGVQDIAQRVHNIAAVFAQACRKIGYAIKNEPFFDTVAVMLPFNADELVKNARNHHINIRKLDIRTVSVTFDETVSKADLSKLLSVFESSSRKGGDVATFNLDAIAQEAGISVEKPAQIETRFARSSSFLTHPVFNSYHSETEMLRYIYRLQSKDLSLTNSMIPLGSCTMKLNATTEMIPITWPEFTSIHPFVPTEQAAGYHQMIQELEFALSEVTGFDAVSLQPNSGAQGEYAGLRVIRAYQIANGQQKRNICLIPVSAHGTNPASAAMCGLEVVSIKCEKNGNLDFQDLKEKAEKHSEHLSCIMVTYPSTFGVFEDGIADVCDLIHAHGGLVYMDGANMNAQVGICRPGDIGADVCHLNLHKTFCIPHGGGGPGMGPIGVKAHLAPFLPGHPLVKAGGEKAIGPISAAPFGSANILSISWAYLKMMGDKGLRKATQVAMLNANYMAKRLESHYKILFTNANGMCAHEFIIDLRPFSAAGIEAIDVAKRLQDYGFHSPTMSWPVGNTLMIEPTESESKEELDRYVDALISIRHEIEKVEKGEWPRDNNPLVKAPHTQQVVIADEWNRPYSREVAAYPLPFLRQHKFWPSVSRLKDAEGDRHLICTCQE